MSLATPALEKPLYIEPEVNLIRYLGTELEDKITGNCGVACDSGSSGELDDIYEQRDQIDNLR